MKRHSYSDKLRMQVRQWQDKIDQLRASIKQSGSDTRRNFEHRIQDLQAKQRAARRKLEQLDHGHRTGSAARVSSRARVGAARVQRVVRKIVSSMR